MTDMAGATLNVLIFESEDAARSALEPVRSAPRPPWMQLESADVYEVLASSKAFIGIEHAPLAT
jgi:hypothetical protein